MALVNDYDTMEIDRPAIEAWLVGQFQENLEGRRDALELTDDKIRILVERFRHSEALRKAADAEIQHLQAIIDGRIH